MNHDTPPSPREELEARLTALLLGELPEAEAAALREVIQRDAALAALHDRLSRTIALVRETAATAEQPSAAPPAPLKLSDHRRQKLLQHFKTVAPQEFQRPRRSKLFWVELSAAAAVLAILAAISLPNLGNFRGERSSPEAVMELAAPVPPENQASDSAAAIVQDETRRRSLSNPSAGAAFYRIQPKASGQPIIMAAKPVPTAPTAAPAPALPADHTIYLPTVENSGEVAQTPQAAPSLAPPSPQRALSGSPSNPFLGRNTYIVKAEPQETGVGGTIAEAQRRQPNDVLMRQRLTEAKAAQDRGDNATFNKLIAEVNGAALGLQGGTAPTSVSGQTTAGLPLVDPATGLLLPPGSTFASATAAPIDPATGLPVPAVPLADQLAAAESPSMPTRYAQASDISQALESLKAAPSSELAANGGSFNVPPGNQPLTQPQLVYDSGVGGGGGGGGAATFAKHGTQSEPTRMYRQESPTLGADKSTDDLRMTFAGTPKELARNEPPQVNIKAKFVDVTQSAPPALGYDWSHGNSPEGKKDVEAVGAIASADASQSSQEITLAGVTSRLGNKSALLTATLPSGVVSESGTSTSITNGGAIFLPFAQDTIDGFSLGPSLQNQGVGAADAVGFEFDNGVARENGRAGKVPLLGDVPYVGALSRPKDFADASKYRALDQDRQQADEAGSNGERLEIVGYVNVPAPTAGYTFQTFESTNSFAGIDAINNPASVGLNTDGSQAETFNPGVSGNQTYTANTTFASGSFTIESATNAILPGITRSPIVLPPVPSNAGTELAYYDKNRNAAADSDYLSTVSAVQEAEVKTSPSAVPAQAPATVIDATAASDPKSQLYWEAKRDLEELQKFRQILDTKIAQEKIDYSLPKTTMVEIVDTAQPPAAQSPTFLEGLRRTFGGKVEATARLKVERDQSDIAGLADRRTSEGYDPYFVQTEFEALQSDAVLGKVVKDLDLNAKWGKSKGAGQPLETKESIKLLKKSLDLRPVRNTSLIEIGVKSDNGQEAAQLANAVAEAYVAQRAEKRKELAQADIASLEQRVKEQNEKVQLAQAEVDKLTARLEKPKQEDAPKPRQPAPSAPADEPQPEVQSRDQAFSTFSLNVSDVSFKLAAASLEKGVLPEPASVRSEEFINAFDYRDPEPPPGVPVAFAWERARYPFAQNRDLLRFSIKTAAQGREPGRPLNLVLLLDTSGSMERADRVRIIHEALRVLAAQLQPQDKFSVVTFARTARLWVDGVPGNEAARIVEKVGGLTPQGGTNLEEAMKLAYQTALRHYLAAGVNRVVLLTDGAANLGNVDPTALKQRVEAHRKQGIALDCFGIGWEGYNDDLLEVLTRNGDGRYGFINTPAEAADGFAGQLAGALHVAAADVKVQVEFNPRRVTAYRQLGYAKHQLTKEQFRDNTVAAAQIGAAESGNALYVIAVNPRGEGPLCTVRVRYKVPATGEIHEHEWTAPYNGNAVPLEEASPAMRLAATASAFSEWLASSPYAADVTPDRLLGYLRGVPEVCGADARPKKLEWMLRQAKSIAGK